MRGSCSIELARLKKEEKHLARFAMLSRATEILVGHENTRR